MCAHGPAAPRPERGSTPPAVHERHAARIDGRRETWDDFGGDGTPLLALHGTFGRGAVFAPLARHSADRFRVIAPDLRGHGHSDRADDYGSGAFVADVAAFVLHLGLGPLPVLGHSRGGIVAYRLAAAHAESVSSLTAEAAREMCRRRERTRLVEFPGAGHWIHDDDAEGVADEVAAFLAS